MTEIVATASWPDKDGNETYFTLYKPEVCKAHPHSGTCRYTVTSSVTNVDHQMHGVDTLQALAHAMVIIDVRAKRLGIDLHLFPKERKAEERSN